MQKPRAIKMLVMLILACVMVIPTVTQAGEMNKYYKGKPPASQPKQAPDSKVESIGVMGPDGVMRPMQPGPVQSIGTHMLDGTYVSNPGQREVAAKEGTWKGDPPKGTKSSRDEFPVMIGNIQVWLAVSTDGKVRSAVQYWRENPNGPVKITFFFPDSATRNAWQGSQRPSLNAIMQKMDEKAPNWTNASIGQQRWLDASW